jgi:mannose-6-phosphate isomerase-like protein (cupin superfamily)
MVAGTEVEPKASKNVWYVVSGMAKKNLKQKITSGLN